MLGGEAPTTWEAQGPSCFRLVGATWAWLTGLEPIHRMLARWALTCNEPRAQFSWGWSLVTHGVPQSQGTEAHKQNVN